MPAPLPTTEPDAAAGSQSPNRRPDIQGLRAIAVLMVVALHAGLPFPGGFVGVDVFFVISGFVITAMLHREWLRTGGIRFGQFYLRRFKRLTPALALMIAVTMVISAVVLSPLGPQQNAAKTGAGAMLLAANFVIARITGGYFDAPAATNPLLNTWSLSVEEQFYHLVPALLALGWMLARRRGYLRFSPLALVTAVAVTSFALAVAGSMGLTFRGSDTVLGFYSPFTRAWEFAAGALLAMVLANRTVHAPRLLTALGLVGIALLAASLWLITGTTPFPGPWTLLPVTGTLLLLFAGNHVSAPTTQALASKPMVKIGDWSYSIYLWHWPLIVFAVAIWPLSPYASIMAALISFGPALASYIWVETPIRTLGVQGRLRTTRLVAIVLVPPLLLAGLLGATATKYWQPRFEAGEITVAHAGDTDWTDYFVSLQDTYSPCANSSIRENALEWEGITRCRQSKPGPEVDVAIVGDSHAEQLFLGLAEAAPDKNIAYYALDALPIDDGAGMSRILEEVAKSSSIKTVIVNADWAQRGAPEGEIAQTLRTLSSAGKQVFVTDDVPIYPFDAIACKYRQSPLIPITRCIQPVERFQASYLKYYPALKAAVDEVPGVHLLSAAQYFCNEDNCDMTHDGELLYRDDNHLNDNGSRYLAKRLIQDNSQLKTALTNP